MARAMLLSLSETHARIYWWCSPPKIGTANVCPTVWTARGIGASFCSDKWVRASLVIFLIRFEQVTKMPLAKHDHMVKAIPPDRSDEPLRTSVLPW